MILKELRISRHLSQEQLAQMSGLNVRTIQRIESGNNASVESLKCLASVLEVDVATLTQERMMIDKNSDVWRSQPLWLKWWFFINYLSFKPLRKSSVRGMFFCHACGFALCAFAWFDPKALPGGLAFLLTAYFFHLLVWQGDKYGVWYDKPDDTPT
ncbi:helix-turn-helix domain-containing protein [Cellvibrio sp.]